MRRVNVFAVLVSPTLLAIAAGCDSGTNGNGGCNGCVAGNAGNGNDSIQIEFVSGLDDGVDDAVTVEGTYTLDSASEASLRVRCDGDCAGVVLPTASEGTHDFSAELSFIDCEPGIVMASLWEVDPHDDSVFVDCCFREGRDF
jgi:hypothetical protein